MRRALIISTVAHAVAIGWGVVSFATKLHEVPPVDSMPIDIITAEQLSKITAGSKTGDKDKPKPLVEKVAEEKKPVDDIQGKVSEKKEITTASAAEPPKPVDKPPEKKPDPKPEPKPVAEPKEAPKPVEKKPEPKTDPIAEALKKDEAKKPKPKQEAKAAPPQQPPQPKQEQKFDANRIAALLDKRDPQRQAATGDALNMAPSLGTSRGNAAQLSQSELDALRARLMQLWNPPVGNENPQELVVRIRIQLTPDGKLAGPPMVLTSGQSVRFQTARDSAIRAVFRGQPYNMLRKETYEQWKDIEVTFDPRDMFRG
jgi:colicin import membrane protein